QVDRRLAHRTGHRGAAQQQGDQPLAVLFARVAADAQERQVCGGKTHGESLRVSTGTLSRPGERSERGDGGDAGREPRAPWAAGRSEAASNWRSEASTSGTGAIGSGGSGSILGCSVAAAMSGTGSLAKTGGASPSSA